MDRHDLPEGLLAIPNVGPATARDLVRLGIHTPLHLAAQEPAMLYARLCRLDGYTHDPCVEDVFAAAIEFCRTGRARPWWHHTRVRRAERGRS